MPTGINSVLSRIMQSERTAPIRANGMRAARLTYGLPQVLLPHRHDLPRLFNRRDLLGCGAEIGVKRGEFSQVLLEAWEGRHLISIDPWAESDPEGYVDFANVAQDEHDSYHQETVDRLHPFGDRSSIWRMTGAEASDAIPHHALDFVYLDARHDYASVLEDLGQWSEKVRPGGVLSGHDYIDGMFVNGNFGVRSAVDEFFGRLGWRVSTTNSDGPWLSWFVFVPR